jgi:adenine-specific DNA-methyltransferase
VTFAELGSTREDRGARKARGAFFTPPEIADYVVDWAVRSAADEVLEPSAGEAAFLVPAATRLKALARTGDTVHVSGVEIHAISAERARELVAAVGADARIVVDDFFSVPAQPSYDAVIGNPPFMRYQEFVGASRTRARESALRAGVSLSALASSWAAFTIHSASFLKPGGRLALVLPAELLSVNYAAAVRTFLLGEFRSVELVLFTERVFTDVLEEVVLVLADGFGEGPAHHASIYEAHDASSLASLKLARTWAPEYPSAKWTRSMLPSSVAQLYVDSVDDTGFTTLRGWGETTLGMVTGNNRYFAISRQRFTDLGLAASDVMPLSPPGSRHLRGLHLGKKEMDRLEEQGRSTLLFRPRGAPSAAALEYILTGERMGVAEAYKCRVRSPWWKVPLVRPADLLLTYMNSETVQVATNTAGALHLNSVHGIYLRPELQSLGRRSLPIAMLNSLTMLGAETVGRSYGGGILKVEPREADELPVPTPDLLHSLATELQAITRPVTQLIASHNLLGAVELVDSVVLTTGLRMGGAEIDEIRRGRTLLAQRRKGRGAK